MTFDGDELAGVVDLFGALTRQQLRRGLVELAYRRGDDLTDDDADDRIRGAVEGFYLAPYGTDPERLAAGPAAFPELPERADDLPHVLDAERRSPDRGEVAAAAERRLADAVERAAEVDDAGRLRELRDLTYDLEAWGPVDATPIRATADDYL
jgi:hypothetical protein